MGMRKHFRWRHLEDIIMIEEEGLLPQCVECGFFQKNVNTPEHLNSEECKQYAEIKRNKRLDLCNQAAINVKFEINEVKLKEVKQFKYLGRVLENDDDDLTAVENQIAKARMTWGRIGKVIKKKSEGNVKVMATFYKVIVQSVLLYGSESWVLSEHAKRKLKSFHNRCARFVTGRHIRKIEETWIYPSSKDTLELAGLLTIDEYITKRKETVKGYAVTTEIFKKWAESSNSLTCNSLEWGKEKFGIRCDQNPICMGAILET